MNANRRVLRDVRFEVQGRQLVMSLTTALDRELVVEQVPLGEFTGEEMIDSLQKAIQDLRQLASSRLVSAA